MLSRLKTALRALLRRAQAERELDEELRHHIERQTEQNIRLGMTPEEARTAARKAFGGVEQAKERSRDARGVRRLEDLWQDLRFGARMLGKNPGFTLIAVITLALGIGANTAIFSVINAVLLRPLPYPESERLVWLAERLPDHTGLSVAYPNFADWRSQQTVFESFGGYMLNNFILTGRGDPVQLKGVVMSADVFLTLRAQPALGRVFSADEDKAGAAPVVVISYGLWQSRYGGDPDIVNQAITLDGRAYTVLGVMPAGFAFPSEVSLWAPVGPIAANPNWQNRNNHPDLFGVARLKPGATLDQARADLDTIAARLEQQYPGSNKDRRVQVDRLLDTVVGAVRRNLWTLFGAVGLTLLIACANVANLLLARAAARQREMAVRAALGASRLRIVRQLLVESMLLSILGSAAGLLLAQGTFRVIATMAQGAVPRVSGIGLDGTVLFFSAGLALLTGLLFGLAPAWQASRADLQETLKDAARGVTSGRGRLRHGLVVAEVALTLILLVGAGLLLRSFYQLQQVHTGFVSERVLSFRVDLLARKYPTAERQIGFYQELLEKLRALPGVQTASIASRIPLDGRDNEMSFLIEGQPEPAPGKDLNMDVQVVAPDYFRALGIPVLRGRGFTEQDNRAHLGGRVAGRGQQDPSYATRAGLNAIVVDEEFARRYWPNEDPIGPRVRLPWGPREENPVLTIIGVVGRVKLEQLSEQGETVQAYLPFLQTPRRGMTVLVKTSLAADAMIALARKQMLALDPEQPIHQVITLSELRTESIASQRLNLTLLGAFAAVALALAAIGLYGALAYAVAQRTREIGIRMALGAQTGAALQLVVGQGMKLALMGVVIGLIAAFALTRLIQNLLFGVSVTDPTTFILVAGLFLFVALLACFLPARQAMKVDPMIALRFE